MKKKIVSNKSNHLSLVLLLGSMLLVVLLPSCFTSSVNAFSALSLMTMKRHQQRNRAVLFLADETPDSSSSAASSSESEEATAAGTPKPAVKCPNCELCDGSGRIAGGLGAVLPWLPVKAYRPCPNFIDNGGFYQRSGQPLDEIAFGRDSTYDSSSSSKK